MASAGVGTFYPQKRARTAPPKPGAGLSIQLELFEGGIVNATCEKNDGLRNCILKPNDFKWVQSLGVWQHSAGSEALVRALRAKCDDEGVALTVIDRAKRVPTVTLAELVRQEEERHRQTLAQIQSGSPCSSARSNASWSQGTATSSAAPWHHGAAPPAPLQPPTAGVPPAHGHPPPPSDRFDDDPAFTAALMGLDEQVLLGRPQPLASQAPSSPARAPSQGFWQGPSQGSSQGLSQGLSQASASSQHAPGTLATAAAAAVPASPTPQAAPSLPSSNITAEQQERIELNRQRALARRAQRQA